MYRHNPLAAASVSVSIQRLSCAANGLTRVCTEILLKREQDRQNQEFGLSTALKQSFLPTIINPPDMRDILRKIK